MYNYIIGSIWQIKYGFNILASFKQKKVPSMNLTLALTIDTHKTPWRNPQDTTRHPQDNSETLTKYLWDDGPQILPCHEREFPFPSLVGNIVFYSLSQSQYLETIFFIPIPDPKSWDIGFKFPIPIPTFKTNKLGNWETKV